MPIKIAAGLLILFLILTVFSACKNRNDPTINVYTTADVKNGDAQAPSRTVPGEALRVSNEWQKNYAIKYTYFNKLEDVERTTFIEKMCGKYYYSEESETGVILYYTPANGGIDQFYLQRDMSGAHLFYPGKKLSDIETFFMEKSKTDPRFVTLKNVEFIIDDKVAGREMKKYVQSVTEGDRVDKYATVWIDAEYGFTGKCEFRDAEKELLMSWELLEFKTGGVGDSDIKLNLRDYVIVEQ